MKRFWSIVAMLSATPALAQPAAELDALYAHAVAARQAGDGEKAVADLERLVVARPGDSDAWLQLGLSYLLVNRLDSAEHAFGETLHIAPSYQDARIGLARVAVRRGEAAVALAKVDEVLVAEPANQEALALQRELREQIKAAQPLRWRADLELSYSDLEKPQADWREAALRIGYRAADDLQVNAAVEASRRFRLNDVYLEGGVTVKFAPGFIVQAAFGGTPSADFRPEWQVSLGMSAELRKGRNPTQFTLDLRQSRFPSGDIQSVNPGVVQYLANGRVWLTGRWINTFDERAKYHSGWLARGDVLANEKLRFFAGYADAPDTSAGVVIETQTVFGGAVIDISRRYSLTVSAAHEDRAIGSDRLQLSAALGVRF